MTIITQFVIGVVTICVVSVSFLVLYCTLAEIGGQLDPIAGNDTERFLTGFVALIAVVVFVVFALVMGDIAMKFLGLRG